MISLLLVYLQSLHLKILMAVPSFLEKALSFIENYGVKVEGILRQSADVEEVKQRVRDYEKGKNEFALEEDAHVIGDCIKYVLREMPSAPVPAQCCTALVGAFRTDRTKILDAMHMVVYEVFPEPNRQLLQRILKMMQIVAEHKAVNLMSQSALAACMAPLLLRPLLLGECEFDSDFTMGEDGSLQLLQAAATANHAQAIVIILLEEYDQIFDDLEEGSCYSDDYTESEDDDVDKEYSTDNDVAEDDGSYVSGGDDIDEGMDENTEHSPGGTSNECGSNIGTNVSDDKVVKINISGISSREINPTVRPPIKTARIEQSAPREDIDQIASVPHDSFPMKVAQDENTSQRESSDKFHPKQESCEPPNGSADHIATVAHSSSSRASKFIDKSSDSMHKSRQTVRRPVPATQNLSMEEIDYCSDPEWPIHFLLQASDLSKSSN